MDNAPAGAAAKGSSNGSAKVKNESSAAESGAGVTSPSGKSVDEGKRSTTGQGAVDEGVVGGPKLVRHRHYRHYRHYRNCLPNIFDRGNCW